MNAEYPVRPTVHADVSSERYARFRIEPLEPGFGLTLGNALRRILLSSISGAAITSLRVDDVLHEFSAIPDVREDMLQVIAQLKQVRLKLSGAASARLWLEVQGAGTVTAGDLICPPEAEIGNPDLYLFTVDNQQAQVRLAVQVEAGRGYSPADESQRLPIGELPLDAIFSPVRRVNFEIMAGPAERLLLDVWTDGTHRPAEVLGEAARLLLDPLLCVVGGLGMAATEPEVIGPTQAPAAAPVDDPLQTVLLDTLELSVRVHNSLRRAGIDTVGEALAWYQQEPAKRKLIRNFGEKALEELAAGLKAHGYLRLGDVSESQQGSSALAPGQGRGVS